MSLPSRSLLSSPILWAVLAAGLLPLSGCTQDQASSSQTDTLQTQTLAPAPETTVGDTTVDADVPYVATPQKTVAAMLELANVTKNDTVYDLGSGDGRIPIMAAQRYGAYGVGIEIKPSLVHRARKNAKLSGVSDMVEFRQQDIFKADFSDATVVTMYLFPEVNMKLRPMLFEQLEPGTRVVSHSFDMNEWAPDSTVHVNNDVLYLWTIPEKIPDHLTEE
ncbi:MAG: cyclopropane-fatty-acyl-phospholipid synthase family protein [Salinibacter sp.]